VNQYEPAPAGEIECEIVAAVISDVTWKASRDNPRGECLRLRLSAGRDYGFIFTDVPLDWGRMLKAVRHAAGVEGEELLPESFVGRQARVTLKHYVVTFGIEWGQHGIVWAGRAWNSLFTTLQLSALAAPLTAAIGLLTAYLLARQTFAGKQAFEFTTMLSFAIPGTVIGVSYIVAFNVPPLELTGTGIILVICFVFRNMPVAIRAGVATLSQIDKSLDECSLMLRHGSFATLRRVVLPLLRPAIVAALVYSFVRAITSVSAVVFLVSAEYNLATAYIVNRVEVSDYGVAIAYSSALVVIMAVGVGLIQLVVGERRLGRRGGASSILREASA
jgi:iron(III) transport system permease protein